MHLLHELLLVVVDEQADGSQREQQHDAHQSHESQGHDPLLFSPIRANRKQKVYHHLRDLPSGGRYASPREIAAAIDINAATVRTALARLERRGWVSGEGATRSRVYFAMPEKMARKMSDRAWDIHLQRGGVAAW